MRLAGNVPNIDVVLQDVAPEDRENSLYSLWDARCCLLGFLTGMDNHQWVY